MKKEVKEIVSTDQTLAESLTNNIKFNFVRYFLVKPLPLDKVEKEFSIPVASKEPIKDDCGIEAKDYDAVKKEIRTVDSDWRKGVVLKVPVEYNSKMSIDVGDTIVYNARSGIFFDLYKDSQLVAAYDIVSKCTNI